jgi:hypothetical protein
MEQAFLENYLFIIYLLVWSAAISLVVLLLALPLRRARKKREARYHDRRED